jgi:hypothetical protein
MLGELEQHADAGDACGGKARNCKRVSVADALASASRTRGSSIGARTFVCCDDVDLRLPMRIRFQADFTQPPLKAWFNVGNAATISELKRALITGVKGLQDARAEGSDLVLLLDDFEVLDESPIDVLREGELIWYVVADLLIILRLMLRSLRQSTPSVSTTTKRKSTADGTR